MEIRLLGPVEGRRSGARIELGPPRQCLVLAALAMLPGTPVSVETLIDRVWGDEPPDEVRGALYTYVSKLRRALGRDAIVRQPGGYVAAIDPEQIDATRFKRLLEQGRASSGRDPRAARERFRSALALWHGPPLADLPGDWADRARRTLSGLRLAAVLELSDVELRVGDPDRFVEELADWLREYPLSEPLTERYLRALLASGRRAEALDSYARTRTFFADELGDEPGPELQKLHERILRRDPDLDADRRVPARAHDATREPGSDQGGHRPRWIGPRCPVQEVIGRDAERAELARLLRERRLVTVIGIGGCGKSTLALKTAEDFGPQTSEILVVPLSGVPVADQVVSALGSQLGVPGRSPQDIQRAVQTRLGVDRTMLVLDNCEHLGDGLGVLLTQLLSTCPELTILATSRQPIGLSEEVVWPLVPLRAPDPHTAPDPQNPAIRLFTERARDASPAFAAGAAELADIAVICRRLDGIPLALELAAARVRAMPVRQLADRLNGSLVLLDAETPRSDPRHRTLHAVLDWSFGLLPASARDLLAYLSVFVGGFTLDAAEAVGGDAAVPVAEVAGALATLVDRSLVQVVQPSTAGGECRYRLLVPIREYARAVLEALGGVEQAADRHLDYWVEQALTLDALPTYHQRVAFASALRGSADDIQKALEHGFGSGRSGDAATLTARGFELWLVNDAALTEGEAWLRRSLDAAAECQPMVRSLLQFHHTLLFGLRGDYAALQRRMRGLIGQLAAHRAREYREGMGSLLSAQRALLDPSGLTDAPEFVSRAVRPEPGDSTGTVLNAATTVLTTWARWDDAAALARQVHEINARRSRPNSWVRVGNDVEIALGRGDHTTARTLARELLNRLGNVPHPLEQEPARRAIAVTYLCTGEPERAREFLGTSIDWFGRTYPEALGGVAPLRGLRAEACRRCGDLAAARSELAAVLEGSPTRSNLCFDLNGVLVAALLAHDLGQPAVCETLAASWDRLRRRIGLPVAVHLAEPAADILGLDPQAPAMPDPAYRWNEQEIRTVIAEAASACARLGASG